MEESWSLQHYVIKINNFWQFSKIPNSLSCNTIRIKHKYQRNGYKNIRKTPKKLKKKRAQTTRGSSTTTMISSQLKWKRKSIKCKHISIHTITDSSQFEQNHPTWQSWFSILAKCNHHSQPQTWQPNKERNLFLFGQ